MKKLMFTAVAAVLWGTVSAEIESANVVGYDQTALRFGSKGVGASFVNVSGGNIDIQDLTPVTEDYKPGDGYEDEEVELQILNENGGTSRTFVWIDAGTTYPAGWYEDGELADYTFAPGEGFYAGAPDSTWSIQNAGAVPTEGIAVRLRFGSKHVVNPTPVAVNLNDYDNDGKCILPSGTNYEPGDGYEDEEVELQILNENGGTVRTFVWIDALPSYFGWYEDGELVENVQALPGEGFYAGAPDNSWYINFPGVSIH